MYASKCRQNFELFKNEIFRLYSFCVCSRAFVPFFEHVDKEQTKFVSLLSCIAPAFRDKSAFATKGAGLGKRLLSNKNCSKIWIFLSLANFWSKKLFMRCSLWYTEFESHPRQIVPLLSYISYICKWPIFGEIQFWNSFILQI